MKTKSVWRSKLVIEIRTRLGTQMLEYGARLSGLPYIRTMHADPTQGLLMIVLSSRPFDIPNVKVSCNSNDHTVTEISTMRVH